VSSQEEKLKKVFLSEKLTRGIPRRKFLQAGMVAAAGAVTGASSANATTQKSLAGEKNVPRLFPFAAAQPPHAEYLFPSQRWLEAIAHAGYTHVFLQVDPFYHPEADLSTEDEDAYWLLQLYNMTAGPTARSYQSWLRAISDAVGEHGLKLGMELWEPQLSRYAQQVFPDDWKGPALRDGNQPLCVSQPAAREWFLNSFRTVLAAAPAMNAITPGAIDNRANLCDSRCPRCGPKELSIRFSELYKDIDRTCGEVRSDFNFIPYDWEWPDNYFDETLQRLPRGTSVLTRLEKGAVYTPDPAHPEWSGHVEDQCTACEQLGPGFSRAKTAAAAHGGSVLAMFTLSGMFEGWELPYVPAAGKIARKFDLMRQANVRGWVDYDCGGIHEGLMLDLVSVVQHNPKASVQEWLHLLVEKRYQSPRAIESALSTWQAFDRAVEFLPAVLDFKSIRGYSGRFGIAMGLVPMMPFLPERARQAKDFEQEFFWFDPHNFLTQEALPAMRHCMSRALEFAQQGLQLSKTLTSQASPQSRQNAQCDEAMATLTVLAWQSISNFFSWAAGVQGDKSVPLVNVIQDEIEVTRRYRELQVRPELEVGNMMWAWQRELARCIPQAATDTYNCSKLSTAAVTRPFPQLAGNYYAWKIAGLEEQLKTITRP
jgi:hypothetical protein